MAVSSDHRSDRSRLLASQVICSTAALIFSMLLVHAAAAQSNAEAEISLPMDIEKAAEQFDMNADFEVVQDDVLEKPVILHNHIRAGYIAAKAGVTGSVEVIARVRLPESERVQVVTMSYGATGNPAGPDAPFAVQAYLNQRIDDMSVRFMPMFGAAKSRSYANETQLLMDDATEAAGLGAVYFRPRYRDVSPVSEPEFRKEIESVVAAMPKTTEQFFELRIVHTPEYVRYYRDNYLLAERSPSGNAGAGVAHLAVTGAVHIASFEVRKLDDRTPGYEVIGLEGYANASLADQASGLSIDPASLPKRGELTELQGVPMRLPVAEGGNDHIDVGPSLFHYRNEQGHYMSNVTWPNIGDYDHNRIRLSVPNRPYNRMWVLAASDGAPNSVPLFTARFYRPLAGFPFDTEAAVPTVDGKGSSDAKPVPVKMGNGKAGNLWLIPLEFDAVKLASEMREQPYMAIELTKKVFPYRAYPDPANYNWFQGGLPSGVHILAITLEHTPAKLIASGNRNGNVYVSPEEPVWQVKLRSLIEKDAQADVKLTVKDPLGKTATFSRKVILPAGGYVTADIPIATSTTGLHDVSTEVTFKGGASGTLVQHGTFVQLPLDTRNARATTSHWGLWTWGGTHGTNPDVEENMYLNLAAGAHFQNVRGQKINRRTWDIITSPQHVIYGPAPYSLEDEIDPEKRAAFKKEMGEKVAKRLADDPTIPSFSIFTETAITPAITYGVPREYTGEDEEELWDEDAKKRFAAFWETAIAACEGIREHAPKAKIALGWCEPAFTIPFLKRKFPTELFDLIGVDAPTFERTPEMPIREIAPNRMWLLKQAMHKYGYADKPVIHTESYYPSSHELALGHRGSANHTVRLAVLSLALESDILANCFTVHDASNYWGSQHYGCIGLIGRAPEWNPKPSFPAYATMTTMIDREQFDGFVPTGSMSTYCVRFKIGSNYSYCLWTIRGERDIKVNFSSDDSPLLVNESGAQTPLTLVDNSTTITVTDTPVWIRSTRTIDSVEAGEARYPEATPGYITEQANPHVLSLDDMSKAWAYKPGKHEDFDESHWAAPRHPGPMTIEAVDSKERGKKVTRVDMQTPETERPLMAFYGAFEPAEPVAIPGRAKALGIWVNGRSNWGRIVYEVQDANGETWRSTGKKDDWNCDDTHSWSSFNFDGWRYIEFPLPSHEPGDNYRHQDTVWWGYDDDGIVDLPLKLTRIYIEARTHHVYVDELQPIEDRSVELSDLVAVYGSANDATDAPVKLQQDSRGISLFKEADVADLPNPLEKLRADADAPPAPKVTRLAPPEHFYDGTRIEFGVEPVEGATLYQVYVSPYEDGSAASVLAKGAEPTLLVRRLRPEMPIYLFATYVNDKRKESKPSEVKRVLLRDDFPMK